MHHPAWPKAMFTVAWGNDPQQVTGAMSSQTHAELTR